jgi:hypothetical protein
MEISFRDGVPTMDNDVHDISLVATEIGKK